MTTLPPTTAVPTTLSPTTLSPTTGVPTTTLTTPAPTTAPPSDVHDPGSDKWFNCAANNYAGVLQLVVEVEGVILSRMVDGSALFVEVTIEGRVIESSLITSDTLEMVTSIEALAITNMDRTNWIGWSKIGEANFAMDRVNDAGFRPMEWTGYVYQILKLGKGAIVYGSGGVSMAVPVTEPMATFGFREVLNVGVKNRTAVAGDETVHYFIDNTGCLWKLTQEGLLKLGFEEFLLPLEYPVLIWDKESKRLHIGDSNTGYIVHNDAMGGGYGGLTGLYRVGSEYKAISNVIVPNNPIYIVTDVMDFGHRGIKTIENFQLGLNVGSKVLAAIDYRYRVDQPFKTSRWAALNIEGVVHLRVAATDFRIRVRTIDHTQFELSYINIQYKSIDKRYMRSHQDKPAQVEG